MIQCGIDIQLEPKCRWSSSLNSITDGCMPFPTCRVWHDQKLSVLISSRLIILLRSQPDPNRKCWKEISGSNPDSTILLTYKSNPLCPGWPSFYAVVSVPIVRITNAYIFKKVSCYIQGFSRTSLYWINPGILGFKDPRDSRKFVLRA